MHVLICNTILMFFLLIALPQWADAAIMGRIGHFPTTSGSSWTYAGSGLTMDRSGIQVIQPFAETVTANGGSFHSEIVFSGGNTTTSDNNYLQEDALYIGSTRIAIVSTVDTPIGAIETTTTTNNSYAPPQEFFPSELYPGNVESSTGINTMNITVVTVTPYGSSSSSTSSTCTQTMRITVAGSEQVTVGAGTFQAIVLSKTITTTEGGHTYTYDITEWYAEGIGLVKLQSANMNRDLVSYSVNPVEPSDVQISGNPGTFANMQQALDAARDGDIIQAKSTTINGALILANSVNISLSGGWDGNFDTVTGVTALHGTLTLEKGSINVADLVIF